jgi:hypothetical protein
VKKEIMMEYFLWMRRNHMTSDSLLTRQAKQIETLPCALFPLLWFAKWMPPRALFLKDRLGDQRGGGVNGSR